MKLVDGGGGGGGGRRRRRRRPPPPPPNGVSLFYVQDLQSQGSMSLWISFRALSKPRKLRDREEGRVIDRLLGVMLDVG